MNLLVKVLWWEFVIGKEMYFYQAKTVRLNQPGNPVGQKI